MQREWLEGGRQGDGIYWDGPLDPPLGAEGRHLAEMRKGTRGGDTARAAGGRRLEEAPGW